MSQREQAPKFDTGLDRSETLSESESKGLTAWYSDLHGTGNLDLVRFVSFLLEHRPELMKRHRFVAEAKVGTQHIGVVANVMLFLHLYTVMGNAEGILYEIIAARTGGATKAEVLDAIALAYLHGGTNGLNAVGLLSSAYLREWKTDGRETKESPWPASWKPGGWDPAEGAPKAAYVTLLEEFRPEVLKEWREMQVTAVTGALPRQLAPLMLLQLAVVRGNAASIRYAAAQAQAVGVTRHEAVDAITWAMSYSGELGLRAVGDVLLEVVRGWPAPKG